MILNSNPKINAENLDYIKVINKIKKEKLIHLFYHQVRKYYHFY